MNKILIPKYVSKLLTITLLVSGLVFLLSDKTTAVDYGFDYTQFDSCMTGAYGVFDSCVLASSLNHTSCINGCATSPNPTTCNTNCDNTAYTSRYNCDLSFNAQIWTDPSDNCAGISVPNYKQIEKRCRTEVSREYSKCVTDPTVGCFVNGEPDLSCCTALEGNQLQSCLYP